MLAAEAERDRTQQTLFMATYLPARPGCVILSKF